MAGKGLIQFVRNNKKVYSLFSSSARFVLGVMKLFVKPDNNLILFNSFGGKKFDDSPRTIYELMQNDERFHNYRLVWALNNPEDYPEVNNKVKSDTLKYFVTALKARCWISNSSIQRGIDFKGKNTYSFNTWHGTPIKKMGASTKKDYDNTIIKNSDTILAQGHYDVEKFCEAWMLDSKKFQVFGLPRNDVLANSTKIDKRRLRKKLNIDQDKIVILFAPTFRDYDLDKMKSVKMSIPIDLRYWEQSLGEKYVILFRAHYEVAKYTKLPASSMWKDVSGYEHLNDLMIASDYLISDYSSIIFDYSILEQPIIGFTYDYNEYEEKRGMYFDIRKEITCFTDSRQLADYIKMMDVQYEEKKCRAFKEKYIDECGAAAEKSVNWIYSVLKEGNI